MKSKVQLILKVIVSTALIVYLLSGTDYSAVYHSLLSAKPVYLFVAFITLLIGKILTGYRWQILLASQEIHISLRSLIASLFVGQFFNSFLPTTIGGDAIRAYDTAVASNESVKSVTTVFMDRLIGLLALVLLAVLALPIAYIMGEKVNYYLIPVLILFLLCLAGLLIVLNNSLTMKLANALQSMGLSRIADQVWKIYTSIQEMRSDTRILWIAFGVSILLQINVVIFHYLISLSLNLDVPIIYYFIIVPIALTILIVPFSINGIGIRESIFVYLLAGLGVPSSDAIALSLLSFILLLTQAVIGGIIFALRGVHISEFTTKQAG